MGNRIIREEKNNNKFIGEKNSSCLESIRGIEKNLDDILIYQEKEYAYVKKSLERYLSMKNEVIARFQTYSRSGLENMTTGLVIINKSIGREEEESKIYQEECKMSPENDILSGDCWIGILHFLDLCYPGMESNIPEAFDLKALLDSLNIEYDIFKDDMLFYIKIHAEESIRFKDGEIDIFSELKKIEDREISSNLSSTQTLRVIREEKENVPEQWYLENNEIIDEILGDLEKNLLQFKRDKSSIRKRKYMMENDIKREEPKRYGGNSKYLEEVDGEIMINGVCFRNISFARDSRLIRNGVNVGEIYYLHSKTFMTIMRIMGDKRTFVWNENGYSDYNYFRKFEEYLDSIGATYHIKKKKKKINSFITYSDCCSEEEISFDITIDSKRLETERFVETDFLSQDYLNQSFLEKLTKSKEFSEKIKENLEIYEKGKREIVKQNFTEVQEKLIYSKMLNIIRENESKITGYLNTTLKLMSELFVEEFKYLLKTADGEKLDKEGKIEIKMKDDETLKFTIAMSRKSVEHYVGPRSLDIYIPVKEMLRILGKSYEIIVYKTLDQAYNVYNRKTHLVNLSIFLNETRVGRNLLRNITDIKIV